MEHVGHHGGAAGDELHRRNAALRRRERGPRLQEVVDEQVGVVFVQDEVEVGLGIVERRLEVRHELLREAVGGVAVAAEEGGGEAELHQNDGGGVFRADFFDDGFEVCRGGA